MQRPISVDPQLAQGRTTVLLDTVELASGPIPSTANSDGHLTNADLVFANNILESRGNVGERQLSTVRAAGFDNGEIVEIVASVALGCFTGFGDDVADVPEDRSGCHRFTDPFSSRRLRRALTLPAGYGISVSSEMTDVSRLKTDLTQD